MGVHEAPPDWWWTIASKGTRCDCCSEPIVKDGRFAFDSYGKRCYCEICADYEGVSGECRISKRMRKELEEVEAAA